MSDHSYWWQTGLRESVHNSICQHVEFLENSHSTRRWVDKTLWKMYENEVHARTSSTEAVLDAVAKITGFQTARLNVSRSVTDTLVAKVGKRPPAVKVTPDDAVYSLKKKAKGLTRFIRAKNEAMELDQLMPLVLRDACVVGTGCVKVYERWGDIHVERVPKEELYVDPRESRYGEPRQLHQKKQYPREVLRELFPKHHAAISMAPDSEVDDAYASDSQGETNMVDVIESWHLRSGPDAKDGKHAIVIDGKTLLYEQWDQDCFPICFLRFSPRRFGFWGTGLLEQGAEIQAKIDAIMQDILESLYYGSQTRILAPRRAEVNRNHLGRQRRPFLLEYEGNIPPIIDAPNPVSKDAMTVLEFLVNQYHELAGISQLETAAKNPLGANASGAALAEWYDIRSERYQQIENGYAQLAVDIDKRAISVAKAIAERDGTYSAKWCDKDTMQRIPWSEVNMEEDQYNLLVEPTGFLPDSRSGKLDIIERLGQMGVFDGPTIAHLLMDEPDIAKAKATETGPRANMERVMEILCDEDEEMPIPESLWDLDLAAQMATEEYNRAQADGAPEAVLERFREFLDWVEELMGIGQEAAPPPVAQGAPAPMQDPLMAGAPPTALPPGPAPGSLPGQAMPDMEGI